MSPFDLDEPASLSEALRLLDGEDETVRPISGGTALMLMMKAGVFKPTRLVDLQRVEGRYGAIEALPDGGLRIGALATLSDVEHAPEVAARAPERWLGSSSPAR